MRIHAGAGRQLRAGQGGECLAKAGLQVAEGRRHESVLIARQRVVREVDGQLEVAARLQGRTKVHPKARLLQQQEFQVPQVHPAHGIRPAGGEVGIVAVLVQPDRRLPVALRIQARFDESGGVLHLVDSENGAVDLGNIVDGGVSAKAHQGGQ